MTTQIIALLKNKLLTASDGAVTVNNTKAWTGIEKTFKLSDNPPVNIMINGSPTINNFPMPLLIHEFKKITKLDDIEEITEEFLRFIGKTVPKTNIKNYINNKIYEFKVLYGPINPQDYEKFIELSKTFNIDIPNYIGDKYDEKFLEMIEPDTSKELKLRLKESIKKVFCQYLITESTGIVISGISTSHYFPSYISLNIILNNNGKMEIMNKKSRINCNRTELEIFGQSDIIDSYFTGIDGELEYDIYRLIEIIIKPTKRQLIRFKSEVEKLKTINKNKMLKNIDSFSDNDLYELIETLIKSTSIKTKLISDIDSTSNDIHIERITKENGIEEKENIYKIIETKEKIR